MKSVKNLLVSLVCLIALSNAMASTLEFQNLTGATFNNGSGINFPSGVTKLTVTPVLVDQWNGSENWTADYGELSLTNNYIVYRDANGEGSIIIAGNGWKLSPVYAGAIGVGGVGFGLLGLRRTAKKR